MAPNHPEIPRISIDDDDLTLTWATYLAGYDRAPIDLFHPRLENGIFLGELNKHPTALIAEYSTWALWERPEFNFGDSRIALSEIASHPKNVRKWLYKLALQAPAISGMSADHLDRFSRDDEESARRGLAEGAAELDLGVFGRSALEWYSREDNDEVRAELIASMSARGVEDAWSDPQEVIHPH